MCRFSNVRAAVAVSMLIAIACSGCGAYKMYPGKRLARAEVARIDLFNLVEVDGEKCSWLVREHGDKVEVLPGHHTFTYTDRDTSGYWGEITLGFVAKPGRSYRLRGQDMFPKKATTGEILGEVALLIVAAGLGGAVGPSGGGSPGPPEEGPDYARYGWIEDTKSREVIAGSPPPPPDRGITTRK